MPVTNFGYMCMLCKGVRICGFDNLFNDEVASIEVGEGKRFELYALRDPVRYCEVFEIRVVEGDEGLRG